MSAKNKDVDVSIAVQALLEKMESNKVELGGKVVSLEEIEGKQKLDKDGNPLFNNDGTPLLWPKSYYVDFLFSGGQYKFKVDRSIFDSLTIDKRYLMIGRVVLKSPFGGGNPYISVEPIRFDDLLI